MTTKTIDLHKTIKLLPKSQFKEVCFYLQEKYNYDLSYIDLDKAPSESARQLIEFIQLNRQGFNHLQKTLEYNKKVFLGQLHPTFPRNSISSNIPYSGTFEFVGRTQELEILHQQLQKIVWPFLRLQGWVELAKLNLLFNTPCYIRMIIIKVVFAGYQLQ